MLHNFLSFGDAEVNLDNQGYVLVSGINNCKADLAKSNGSGKSSIWEGVVWALTGETIRGTKDVVNKFGTDGTYAEILFDVDSDVYKVVRYRDYSNIGTNLKVYINGVDKSGKGIRDTEKLLEQYLPDLNSSLIGSVIILGQGLPQRFTNNTPSGRKEVLEKLSKSDFMIDDIKNRLSDRKVYLSQELRKYEDLDLQYNSQKSIIEADTQKVEQELSEIPDGDIDSEILRLKEELSKIIVDDSEYKSLTEELNNARSEYKNYDLQCTVDISKLEDIFIEPKQELKDNITKLMANITMLKNEIQRLESIKDVCPTCGQKLPDVHKVDTTDLHNKLTNAENERTELQNKLDELNKEQDIKVKELKAQQEIRRKELVDLGESIKTKFTEVEAKYNQTKEEFDRIQKSINDLENDKKIITYKKETLAKRLDELNKQFIEFSDKILYNNNEKDNVKSRLEIVNKMITIATRDFRGFLLSGVIDFINQKSKEYSKEIFDTEEVEFKLDGNNIFIGYCGKQYENLSGGEKQKIDLIVQFSIRDMLSQYLNFSSNILVVDEICDNLDSIGCQKVLNMIATKLTDVSSLFIISHHTDIDIPVDKEILIIKGDDGISKVGI